MWTFPILPWGRGKNATILQWPLLKSSKKPDYVLSQVLCCTYHFWYVFTFCVPCRVFRYPPNKFALFARCMRIHFTRLMGDIRRYSHWIFSTLAIITWEFYRKFHCLEMNICLNALGSCYLWLSFHMPMLLVGSSCALLKFFSTKDRNLSKRNSRN